MTLRPLILLAALVALASASSVYIAHAGQGCGTKHSKCKAGLVCEHKTCKIAKGDACIGREKLCAKGLACTGKKAYKKCEPVVVVIGKGDACHPKSGPRCAPGLVCAGPKKDTKCVWPLGPGAWCDGVVPCKGSLVCRQNKCKTPANGDCKPAGSVCVKNTVCAGADYKRRCVYPRGEGADCGYYPLQVCAAGLRCRKNKCRSPRIAEGGSCLYKEDRCKSGLVCVGDKYAKKCVVPGETGASCTGRFQVCKFGWTCNRLGRCRFGKALPGGRCGNGRPCAFGLECRRGGSGGIRKTCVAVAGVGGPCTTTGEFQCKRGLKCNSRGKCAY